MGAQRKPDTAGAARESRARAACAAAMVAPGRAYREAMHAAQDALAAAEAATKEAYRRVLEEDER